MNADITPREHLFATYVGDGSLAFCSCGLSAEAGDDLMAHAREVL